MKVFLVLLGLLLACHSQRVRGEETFSLWEGGAPGALGDGEKDRPTLTVYRPDPGVATGAAMVICPGGGYGGLASHEGKDYALWLNQQGIMGLVLKYRLGSSGYRHPVMLWDVARAMRWARSRAQEWEMDPERIGVMGSSAGGHLASTLLTHFDEGDPAAEDRVDRFSSRPSLGILCYPVISMGRITHQGSKRNLLGENPSAAQAWDMSSELQVRPTTPPCFVWHTWEDQAVPVENSLEFAMGLQRAGVPFDLHVYQKGRHGIGLGGGHPWVADCLYWLKEQKFLR